MGHKFESVLIPAWADSANDQVGGDRFTVQGSEFKRVVALVAIVAVGFFVPSLPLAGVPVEQSLPSSAAALVVGPMIGGSIVFVRRGTRLAWFAAAMNAFLVTFLAVLYHGYYHQFILLYALVVGAHAVVHGLGPAMVAALLGTLLVPFAIQAGQDINPTDPMYAFIYLTGAALLPWTGGQLARRRSLALSRQLKVTQETQREAVMILARAAEAKDQVTGDHVARVGDLSAELGRRVGLAESEVEDLRFAGMLHDVGKLHLPDRVLLKRSRLTKAEWELVKQHTEWGERILGTTEGFELARRIARSHHENFDGTGYPDRLKGEQIPLVARIVRIADVFDALRHERPYKEAWTIARTLEEIRNGAGTLFDPELANELVAALDGQAVEVRSLATSSRRHVVSRATVS